MSYYTGGNILSILAFFVWIPIALYGFRRWPPAKAMAYLYLGAILLLPEIVFFKVPGLPELAKLELTFIWLLIGALIFHRPRLRTAPTGKWFKVSTALLLGGAVMTVLLNSEGFRVGSRYVPGLAFDDALHAVNLSLLGAVVPFYLGAAMFRSAEDLRVLLKAMVIASLIYSLPQFVELIMSPQMHRWVYGFHQHSFLQTIRASGYRPQVFMAHGLALAIFISLSVMAAAILQKSAVKVLKFPAIWSMGYLWLVLVLSKSVASFLYSAVAVPLVFFASPRTQSLAGAGLVVFLFVYPVARGAELIPVESLKEWAQEEYGAERAGSMMFRLENEETMLERSMERPWFGWGAYCRACLFEPWSGRLESTRDGEWIIQLGDAGIIGYLGKFGFLLFPILALVRRIRLVPRLVDRRLLAGIGLMIGFSAFDLIPNGDFSHMGFVLSGALLGSLNGILQQAAAMRRKRQLERAAAAQASA